MKTRLPASGTSLMRLKRTALLRVHQRHGGVEHAVGEAPLVVVPGADFHQRALGHTGQPGVENGARRVVVEVRGHQRLAVYSSRPFRSVSEACFTALLTSSTLVGLFATNERSTSETLIVGTRIEKPSSLPFRCGSTRPTAAAAPVFVGIMLWVAERARRRSLWYTSVRTWSLVYECTVFI